MMIRFRRFKCFNRYGRRRGSLGMVGNDSLRGSRKPWPDCTVARNSSCFGASADAAASARFQTPDVDGPHAELTAESRGERGRMTVSDRIAHPVHGPVPISQQRECMLHPAMQAEVQNGFSIDGFESFRQGGLRHADEAGELQKLPTAAHRSSRVSASVCTRASAPLNGLSMSLVAISNI